MAVVISDFFSANETALELLRGLHSQHQETIVFQLLAPEELDLPYDGEFVMEDSETGEELPVHAGDFREEYKQRVKTFCDRVRQECVKLEMDYQLLRTDSPLDTALIAYLEKRSAI
jgi:hypothetical protein